MKFESLEHAQHYASGLEIEIMFYKNKVIDITDFKHKHPGKKKIFFNAFNFTFNFNFLIHNF